MDWSRSNYMVTNDISVSDIMGLKSWNILHTPTEDEKNNTISLALILQNICDRLSLQPMIHCWIRPISVNSPKTKYHNKNYNKYYGSMSDHSLHVYGRAIDFHMRGFHGAKKCAEIRKLILPMLDEYDIRMKNMNCNWIHIDNGIVLMNRYYE